MKALVTGSTGKIGGSLTAHLKAQGWTVYAPTHKDMWVEYAKHVEHYMKEIPALDLVICAHGLYGEVATVGASHAAEWREAIAVNLIGTYHVCRAAIGKMAVGQIINLAGGGGLGTPLPLLSSYACSKAAIVSLTRTLAEELQGRIRVNCIFPGMQDSRIHDRLLDAGRENNPHYDAVKRMRDTGEGAVPIGNTLAVVDWLTRANNEETGKTFFARTFVAERAYIEGEA